MDQSHPEHSFRIETSRSHSRSNHGSPDVAQESDACVGLKTTSLKFDVPTWENVHGILLK